MGSKFETPRMHLKKRISELFEIERCLKDIFDSKRHNGACVTSPLPGNQVDGLPGGASTEAVVASWHPRRRATIGTFAKKI